MISILVTNYDYSYLLPLVMQSYNRMTRPSCDVEMVIVDDSSDPEDSFEAFVKFGIYRIKPWYSVRAYSMPLSCSKMNVGRTINVAARQSKGNVLIMNHADLLHLNKDTLKIIEDFHHSVHDPLGMYLLFPGFVDANTQGIGEVRSLTNTAGSSLPRRLFDELGGFDEQLDGYGHEDADFYWRLHYGREIGGMTEWQEYTDKRLILMHLSLCAIGLKRSVYPNPHNDKIVNDNMASKRYKVNPSGWGGCKDLKEVLVWNPMKRTN